MKLSEKATRQPRRLDEKGSYFVYLAAITAVVATLASIFIVGLNRNFLISASDTSIFHNTVVNLVHGHGFRVTPYAGPNELGQHSVFILVPVALLYAIIPSVEMLFTLQVWIVYSAVLPIYLIACEILGKPRTAFFVALLALATPLLFQMAASPFHPESGILPAVFWSYYFYRRNRAVDFWISYATAVCCAEQAALIYVALGVALFFANDGLAWRKRYALFALAGGIAWLIFALGILIPAMYSPGQLTVAKYHYSQWSVESTSGLVLAMAKNPVEALGYLLSPVRWIYLLGLVGLPLALSLLSLRSFLLLLPFPFYFLLNDHEFFLNYHAYYFEFAFFAGYLGLIDFLARPGAAWRGSGILVATAAANLFALIPMARDFDALAQGRDEAFNASARSAFAAIPTNAAVYCPTRFCAYLSNRTDLVVGDLRDDNFDFKARLDELFKITGVPPEKIDYIVCDIANDQCGWRTVSLNPDRAINPVFAENREANIKRYLDSGEWKLFWNQDNVVILQRK